MLKKEVSEAIKRYLVENNVSQQELSDIIGVTRPTIGYWVRGEVEPTPFNLKMIEQVIGVEFKNKPTYTLYHGNKKLASGMLFEISEACGLALNTVGGYAHPDRLGKFKYGYYLIEGVCAICGDG